jgi:hypothetical protein
MTKETYIKPEVKTEILEPEALACAGSAGGSANPARATVCNGNYSNLTCCEKDVWPWW